MRSRRPPGKSPVVTVSTFAAGSATGASPSFTRASLRGRISRADVTRQHLRLLAGVDLRVLAPGEFDVLFAKVFDQHVVDQPLHPL